ncbi:hypothetical protein Tco_0795261 [Tanacetum coccineum]
MLSRMLSRRLEVDQESEMAFELLRIYTVIKTEVCMKIKTCEELGSTKFNAEQEELLASETTEDEANLLVVDIDWDDVQAQIQADEDLAQKLLEEEKENLSIKERARLLAELIDKRKSYK